MAIKVVTNDCTQLSDAELAEMADICADGPSLYEVGQLSKQVEAWVLVSLAREGNGLKGFSFCTLERIGGTPSVLIGLASIKRTSKRSSVLRAILADQFKRAVMAFPDEDVLMGTRFATASGFEAFRTLDDIIPRPDHKATGEERAWGRRLAKRFSISSSSYDDKTFIATGDGSFPLALDYESLEADKIDPEIVALFKSVGAKRGDSLVAFGWAMAEDLAKIK